MALPTVKQHALAVLKVLRASGQGDMAKMLAETIGELDEPDKVDKALARLIDYSHMKWLGDVMVDVGDRDWFGMLDELWAACRQELARRHGLGQQT